MNTPIFQSGGLPDGPRHYPALELHPGAAAGWTTPDQQSSTRIMETVLGLRPPPAGAAVWFGRDLSQLGPPEVFSTLRRLAPLTSTGGLISNLNLGDNIMLPASDRRPAAHAQTVGLLERIVGDSPWAAWLDGGRLTCLPFQCTPLERFLAGVLRARLLEPEAVVCCHVFYQVERAARDTAAAALDWLRSELPRCAWLCLQAESRLPAGFTGNTLEPER